VSDHIQLEIW